MGFSYQIYPLQIDKNLYRGQVPHFLCIASFFLEMCDCRKYLSVKTQETINHGSLGERDSTNAEISHSFHLQH